MPADHSNESIPRTFETGPSEPVSLADGPGTFCETTINAPAEVIWPLVTDINLPAQFSPEFLGAEWVDEGPALGATFTGRNEHPAIGTWEIPLFVHAFVPGSTFGWCTSDRQNPGARWVFDLTPASDHVTLRYSLIIGPGPSGINRAIDAMPDKEPRIIQRRLEEHHANMAATLEGIKQLAEAAT